jgi:DinB superfamily
LVGDEFGVARFYEPWRIYNERIIEVIGDMSGEQLAIRLSPDGWPIWATVGHTAGARVYWLCSVFGEPGADTTPFTDPTGGGWEDDIDHPRPAAELTGALESTWAVVDGCLQRWSPADLFEDFEGQAGKDTQVHTRQGVLVRLLSHDSYHCGELSQTLGINGLPQIDLWRF